MNMFLTRSMPTTRFVIGLDAFAVVTHLDKQYKALAEAPEVKAGADPSTGWSYLRKLVQLQIPVPAIPEGMVVTVVDKLLGVPAPAPAQATLPASDAAAAPDPSPPEPASPIAQPNGTVSADDEPQLRALEQNGELRQFLAERIAALPDLSIRETKRLLTTWQFYVRVAQKTERSFGTEAVERARHLITFAEILTRWPAAQRALLRRAEGEPGLVRLAGATNSQADWDAALAEIGLKPAELYDDLRELLAASEGVSVASMAARLT
jgi:hypothetical protein